MAKHKIKGYVTWEHSKYQCEPEIGFQMYEPSEKYSPEKVVVCEHEIEVDVPEDFDPRESMITRLRKQKREVQAEFAMRVKEIDRRINSLLAIENSAP